MTIGEEWIGVVRAGGRPVGKALGQPFPEKRRQVESENNREIDHCPSGKGLVGTAHCSKYFLWREKGG